MFKEFSKYLKITITSAILVGTLNANAKNIQIGAMREGTSWYVFAATLEQMLENTLPHDSFEIIARGGGVANPMVVESGKADIALSNVATAVWAFNGAGVYKGRKAENIRALVGGLNKVYVGVLARDKFLETAGTSDLSEILTSKKPIRVVMKPAGSSAVPVAEMIFNSVGTNIDEIKANGGNILQLSASQIADQIRNSNADIYIDTMIKGHPTITEVALTTPVTFLNLPEQMNEVASNNGLTIGEYGPWFDGQTEPTTGADIGTVLIANANLSEEIAYNITKTLIENVDELRASHSAFAQFNPEEAWKPETTGIPLHPGAEKYYREAGLIQ